MIVVAAGALKVSKETFVPPPTVTPTSIVGGITSTSIIAVLEVCPSFLSFFSSSSSYIIFSIPFLNLVSYPSILRLQVTSYLLNICIINILAGSVKFQNKSPHLLSELPVKAYAMVEKV